MRVAIPKKAVKPLLEYCNKFGARVGRSGADVFEDYLRWMKKYAGFVFSSPWPAKFVLVRTEMGFDDAEKEFIGGAAGYEEEVERLTVVLLCRNLSLEGFNVEYFESEFDFYGRWLCGHCSVPDAVYLRDYFEKLENTMRWAEENVKEEPNDIGWRSVWEHLTSLESIREEGMKRVELQFLEKLGGAHGKMCSLCNFCLCPHGRKAIGLRMRGDAVHYLWRLVKFYHNHWHRSRSYMPGRSGFRWYHYDEPEIIDVTSVQDIVNAVRDGRMEKISGEFDKYNKGE